MIWRQTNAKMMRDPTTVRSNIRLARPQEDRTWLIGIRNIAMQPEMGRTDGSTSQTGRSNLALTLSRVMIRVI